MGFFGFRFVGFGSWGVFGIGFGEGYISFSMSCKFGNGNVVWFVGIDNG